MAEKAIQKHELMPPLQFRFTDRDKPSTEKIA